MSKGLTELTAADLRRALESVDRLPEVTPRMQRRDEHGALLPRIVGPPAGQTATPAAVLLLLYPGREGLTLAFTRRGDNLRKHAGQISFPGGRVEPDDPSLVDAAIRETREEVGVDATGFELLGRLRSTYVPPSNFYINPFVMYAPTRPHFVPNPDEVAEVLEVPLAALLDPANFSTYERDYQGRQVLEPSFRYGSHVIWGATAFIVDQLLALLEAGLDAGQPA